MQYFYKKRAIIDESADTLPYVDGIDAYSATKRIAEELVLGADNTDNLRTIAVRPAAIYGEGETRHLPRIIKIVRHYILSRPSIITSNLYSSPPCYQSQLSFFQFISSSAPSINAKPFHEFISRRTSGSKSVGFTL